MKTLVVLSLIIVGMILLAGCGGETHQSSPTTNYDTTFHNQAVFESYVAGYLHVDHVSCVKKNATSAECTTPDGSVVLALCETVDASGGHNCSITYKNN